MHTGYTKKNIIVDLDTRKIANVAQPTELVSNQPGWLLSQEKYINNCFSVDYFR